METALRASRDPLIRGDTVSHLFEARMELPLPIEDVFAFFCDAANLQRITPPELGFEIITPLPIPMARGTLIDYRLRLFGVPFGWKTRISEWDPPRRFVDEQLKGPYREWVHEHGFEPSPTGTVMTDRVRYSMPLWPFGEIARPLVRKQIGRIFDYRKSAIEKALGLAPPPAGGAGRTD